MKRTLTIAVVILGLGLAEHAHACSVCFADPESSQGQALNAAVWTLMGVTTFVLGGAATLFGSIAWRTRKLREEDAQNV